MADKKRYFDPERVAQLETAYLRARQDRKRLLMLRQAARLAGKQFQVRLPRSFVAGNYYVTADDAWAAGDLDMTWNSLYRYFRLAQDASGLLFDPAVVGKLAVEARIAQQRVATSNDKSDWLNALIDLNMALWRVPEVVARGAGQWRLRALTTVDAIARGESQDVAADWKKVEGDLERSFKGIHALLTSV
jgi:hypothetical protein